jgi:hypothetical protein
MAAVDHVPPAAGQRRAKRVSGGCCTQKRTLNGQATAVKESLLVEAWRQRLPGKATLTAGSGQRIRILHPGRKNMDSGPDFRDTLITIGRRRLRGDVEVDVRAHHWRAHGHHRDPGFNKVILHVVMWDEGKETSLLQSGEGVPILALAPYLHASAEERGGLPGPAWTPEESCRRTTRQGDAPGVLAKINRAGVTRFRARAAGFRNALSRSDPEQVLYEALMAALGYAKNRESFERLARLLPLRRLYSHASRGSASEIQALMLGTAGLLSPGSERRTAATRPTAGDDVETARIRRRRRVAGVRETMCRSDWRLFRVRPENHPARRIAAASHLLAGCRGELLSTVLACVRQPSAREARRELEQTLTAGARSRPASPSRPGFGSRTSSLIGRGRARDITANVLLPFCFAWAEAGHDRWLRKRARELYVNYPGLQENWITKYMEWQIFGSEGRSTLRRTTCYQQGLIQLYRVFCAGHRCRACPLARRNAPCHSQAAGTGYLPDAEAAEQPE